MFTYVIHPYRPRITLRAWRRLIGFSFWSWALSMTALVQTRSDTIVIGGYLNPTEVGIYSVGGEVGSLASTELLEPITRALFAGFSSARRSAESITSAYLRAVSAAALLTLPANAGIALIARPLMHLAFGERWDAAVPLVQLFACIGVFRVAASISSAFMTAEGMMARAVRVELTCAVVRVVVLLSLVPRFGLIGAASGVAVVALVEEAYYLIITFRHTGLRARDLVLNIWRPTLATGVMALTLQATGLTQPPFGTSVLWSCLLLAAIALIGAFVFGAVLLLSWLASGRPRGAETFLLSAAGQTIGLWR